MNNNITKKKYWILKIILITLIITTNIGSISHANILDSINNVFGTPYHNRHSVSQMDKILMSALNNNDLTLAQRAIDNGANVNCYLENQGMPLNIAINKNDFAMANFLLHRGADPEGYILNGNDKHFYIFKCNLDMITFFIDWGVDPSIKNNYNQNLINSLFHRNGTEDEKLKLILYLIKKGVDINHKGNYKILLNGIYSENPTPLMEAIQCHYTNIAHLLINNGADISKKDNKGHTALDYAIMSNNSDLIKTLMDITEKK